MLMVKYTAEQTLTSNNPPPPPQKLQVILVFISCYGYFKKKTNTVKINF